MAKRKTGNIKAVICVETGVVYASQTEAARETGIPQGNISRACRGLLGVAGNYHWKFFTGYEELEVDGEE